MGLAALLLAGLSCVAIHAAPAARASGVGALQQRIGSGQARASGLTRSLNADSARIAQLGRGLASLQQRLSQAQSLLASRLLALRTTREQYALAHARLLALEASATAAQSLLRRQMVGLYESPQPDLVTVLLQATGFQDLLERLQFAQRVQQQDAHVVERVRAVRRAVSAEAVRLGALELREQSLAAQIGSERDGLARAQVTLLEQRDLLVGERASKGAQLAGVREQLATLQRALDRVRAAQAAAARAAQRAASRPGTSTPSASTPGASTPGASTPGAGATGPAGAPPSAGGGFVFPLPVAAASPPSSWSLDQGVDISAPGGTPEYAVCSGTIVLHGIGGFGPWAPVLHCDSQLRGYSYVYYGHAGPANQLPVGTHVAAGEVMSEVGPGIVGISTGPHLEIGFCDSSGTPLGGQTAPTMLSLLQGAYH
jgi:murein DD-endopeptidase MepM/ murein hydrolase activator NlpD